MNAPVCAEITTSYEGNMLEIAIARPTTKNAFTIAMYAALTRELEAAEKNDEVLVVLLRGEGGNFSSGNDLRDFLENAPTGPESTVFQFMQRIAAFRKPIIAAVEGNAVGIGITLLFHCDIVYAADNAKFCMPFVNLGLVPEAGSTWFMTRQAGQRLAAELLYFGEPFDSQTAREIGVVSRILPADQVLAHARARAKVLAQKSPEALLETKKLLNDHQIAEVREYIDREAVVFCRMLRTPEVREAIEAFFEKRKPDFAKLRAARATSVAS